MKIEKMVEKIERKDWREFQESGMLWWINMLLHTFGWSIVYESDAQGQIVNVYPARVKFRGFSENINAKGYKKVSRYLESNINHLREESELE